MFMMAVYLCANCLPMVSDVQIAQMVDETQMIKEVQVEQDFAACSKGKKCACSNEKKCKGKKPKNLE